MKILNFLNHTTLFICISDVIKRAGLKIYNYLNLFLLIIVLIINIITLLISKYKQTFAIKRITQSIQYVSYLKPFKTIVRIS